MKAAEARAELEALDQRYLDAVQASTNRGALERVEEFELAAANSKAVMARSLRELDRLSSSDRELIPTYYGLLKGQVRLPHGNQWDSLRGIGDDALFLGYREHIRFAALSLDGAGLSSYGECFCVFRERMIGHRASVYEENSAIALKKHRYEPPPGFRATWSERGSLCVAKLANRIDSTTSRGQFPQLLLNPGKTSEEDCFVEVHIWGPMTIRTVERILVTKVHLQAVLMSLRERSRSFGVKLE